MQREGENGHMYRYVVIDDEALIRRAIVKKIASLDLPLAWVGEAEDGEEGLELTLRENPDIVLTDMRMPAMDGVSLLRALSERRPETGLIVISGFSDFEYTREAIATNVIDYILKPFDNNELSAALRKAIAFHREKENRRRADRDHELAAELERLSVWLCRGGADERAPLLPGQYRSDSIKALLAAHSFAAGLLYVAEGTADLLPAERGAAWANARSAERLLAAGVVRLPHPERTDMAVLIVGCETGAAKTACAALRQAVDEVARLGGQAVAAVSRTHGKPEELRAAYREAAGVLAHQPFRQWTGLLQASGTVAKKADWSWSGRDDLLYEIEAGHVKQAVHLTCELFDHIRSAEGATFAQARQYCGQLAHDMEQRLGLEETEESEDDMRGLLEAVRHAANPAELERQFATMVRTAAEHALAATSTAAGQIGQIKQYIDLRYTRPIRLEEVAERFFLHPVYLSMVFKESMGETFQDYLKRLRIERGKQLLSSTKYRIDRIAGMIGYENAKYFYKVFKKETGITPAEYRKKQATTE
ncbi:MAG: hypothetical protein K0Q63_2078 [Paenibacillus sp.]|nr:hypothetical protein [Paenibacillus sp.]